MAKMNLPKRRQTPLGEKQHKTTRESTRKQQVTYYTRENLRIIISQLYGEELLKQSKQFEKLRSKKSKLLADLAFLLRCREKDITPKFLTLSFQKKSHSTNRILHRASQALLRDTIHATRKKLNHTDTELLDLHLLLSNKLHPLVWQQLEMISHQRAEIDSSIWTTRQKQKYLHLEARQERIPSEDVTTIRQSVHNISDLHIDQNAMAALAKGHNFAITPAHIPIEEIICSVEAAVDQLPNHIADSTRQDIAHLLKTTNPPKKRNMSPQELQALKQLKQNPDVTILPADKGNATVIMNTQDYHRKMQSLLQDTAYAAITTDPTTYLEKTTRTKIKSSPIDLATQKQISPREKSSRCPKLYGLPKIHKEDVPLRPIVSAIGSPTHKLAKYVSQQLQSICTTTHTHVKNSRQFIDILATVHLQPEDLLVSFDVVSLFTKIPVNEAIETISRKYNLPTHLHTLMKHVLNNTYFIYNGQRYRQTEGAPMGSPLSPIIANLYMQEFEDEALNSAPLKPCLWLRYVDDTFVIWPHGRQHLNTFLEHLNSRHSNIQFTMETEEDGHLPFLDVLVIKREDGRLGHTVHRKKTHTQRYLNASSHHHPAQLNSVMNTLVHRSLQLADSENKSQEIDTLKNALRVNGYTTRQINRTFRRNNANKSNNTTNQEHQLTITLPYVQGTTDRIARILRKQDIRTAFRPLQTVASLLGAPKDKIPLEEQGVYEVPCGDCKRSYIGQSNRHISQRVSEHRLAVKKGLKTSALAQHTAETGHAINFDATKLLAATERMDKRIIRESIEIEKRPSALNKRDDSLRLNPAWKPAIHIRPPIQQSVNRHT